MLRRGDRLDDFEVVGAPMNGTTTQVFEVRQVVTQERAALKLLHERWRWLPDVVSRFQNERRILAGMRHPHIIAVLHSGSHPSGAPYVVLEWLPFPLSRVLIGEPLFPTVALRCAAQIAKALAALHEQGLLHGELQPKDILMDAEELANASFKLADIGFAKAPAESDARQSVGMLGSPEGRVAPPESAPYLAPEQWRSGNPVDAAADVYALGVLLFQMLAGRCPFRATDLHDLMYQHLSEPPPLIQIPIEARAQAADLLHAMLAKRPDQRPSITDVCELLTRLELD